MKKLASIIFILFCTISVKAQFVGGFGCADPDAWFDKEIYFWCQNQATNGYYGVNLSDVSFVIDGETRVDATGTWYYGDCIFMSQDNGFEFSKGSTVALYVNGYYQTSWTCNSSNPSAMDIAKRAWKEKPRGRMGSGKSVLKILRKLRL